jgi:antitoxin (DNA-binding transcriptional repressor) of toxin-antitoxin stability system
LTQFANDVRRLPVMTQSADIDAHRDTMTFMTALLEETSGSAPVRRIAIRELQQHAARVIRELAEADETAEITSRGRVVARLIPLTPAERAFAEMIERGEVIPAKNPEGLAGWKPLPPREDGVSLSDALIAMREEERW